MYSKNITTRSLLAILFVFIGFSLNAQLEEDYQPASAKGQLPEDFVKLSTTKVDEALEEIDQSDFDRKEKKTRAEFQLTSNFFVDQILLSGQVLFGDEMTTYISDIADRVLAGDTALRDELRFYVVRSSEVNAFSTDPGVIVVTTGLLARADSEAQIAFVLAHEIENHLIASRRRRALF
jgi:Zn-dependent protease with chaperone function